MDPKSIFSLLNPLSLIREQDTRDKFAAARQKLKKQSAETTDMDFQLKNAKNMGAASTSMPSNIENDDMDFQPVNRIEPNANDMGAENDANVQPENAENMGAASLLVQNINEPDKV